MLKSIHFADDTNFYLDIIHFNDHTALINSELTQVLTWIKVNKLSLKVQKTKYVIILNRKQIVNINVPLRGQPITITSNHKFPTILIDSILYCRT